MDCTPHPAGRPHAAAPPHRWRHPGRGPATGHAHAHAGVARLPKVACGGAAGAATTLRAGRAAWLAGAARILRGALVAGSVAVGGFAVGSLIASVAPPIAQQLRELPPEAPPAETPRVFVPPSGAGPFPPPGAVEVAEPASLALLAPAALGLLALRRRARRRGPRGPR